ncbi:MAG: hypothetical protein RLZZ592_590 [Pseudomonadota bacterium]|jgi:type IV pilus assembly protein PilA
MHRTASPALWRRSGRFAGFTLIELMIVIAIVGVLAAISVGVYQDYTMRARVSEGLRLSSEARDMVTEFYGTNLSWPESNTAAGLVAPDKIAGSSVSSITVGSAGAITIQFNASVQGGSLRLEPEAADGTIRWACRIPASGGVSVRHVPAECRGS